MLGARSRMTSLMMFLVCIAGFLPVATAYTYTFIMSVVSVSEGQNGIGPVIRDIRLDGVRPTEDQFNINKMPDRDLCQAHNGATCDAGQIGMIDDDPNTDSNWVATNGAGQEFFSITSPTRVSTIEIASQTAFYTPGWIIEEDGVEMYRDVANRGSVHGSSRSFTYNLAQTTTGVEYLQRAKLTADDGAAEDWFSRYVSIDGDTMVVGAPKDGGQGPGSAYVFTRVTAGDLASSWTQVAKLTADDGAASDDFGISVSIGGGTVVIGAYGDDDKGSNSGSAHVFQLALPSSCVQASTPPRNGTDNDCIAPLAHGDTCTPVCDDGFTAVTASAGCVNGNFFPGECRCRRGHPRSYHGNWACNIEKRMGARVEL